MLKVLKDNTIEIHRRDAFSLLCMLDRDLFENEKIIMYIVDDEKNIILQKEAKKYENELYFVFNSDETDIQPNVYNYYAKLHINELNETTIYNSILKVKESY